MMRYGMAAVGIWLAAAGLATAAPHPFHDDGGAVNWRPSWAAAVQTAQRTGKPLFIEAGREACGICKNLAATTLRDPQVSKLLNRHFVPVVVDIDNPPQELQAHFAKINGKTLPFLLYLGDRGQYLEGTSGGRKPADMQADLEKALQNKAFALTKPADADLTKQVAALEKTLADKSYAKVPALWQAIGKVRGYGPAKDKAFDLLEAAQEDGAKELAAAQVDAKTGDYAEARKRVSAVAKDFAGLPIADEARAHLGALKIIEAVDKLTTDMKGAWKTTATQQLDVLLKQYPDTPYAAVALQKKKELMPKK